MLLDKNRSQCSWSKYLNISCDLISLYMHHVCGLSRACQHTHHKLIHRCVFFNMLNCLAFFFVLRVLLDQKLWKKILSGLEVYNGLPLKGNEQSSHGEIVDAFLGGDNSNIFCFHPYLGKCSNSKNIWNEWWHDYFFKHVLRGHWQMIVHNYIVGIFVVLPQKKTTFLGTNMAPSKVIKSRLLYLVKPSRILRKTPVGIEKNPSYQAS